MADTALIMMMMLMLFGGMGVIAYFILFQDQGAAPGQAAFEAQIMRTATAKQKAEEDKANRAGNFLPAFPFVAHPVLVEVALGDQAVIPTLALMEHFGFRDASGEDHIVHRELF